MEKRIYNERHRFHGILRFSVIEGKTKVLYASLEPTNDILELLADHFLERYQAEPFIIHDLKREKAIFAAGGQWYIAPLVKDVTVHLAQDEECYRALWKNYFETIAIKERTNPNCQRNFMPKKYWEHLTEMV